MLDTWNGCHSLPLSPAVWDATTFINEWGRYQYLQGSQGQHTSGDMYTCQFDGITIDMVKKNCCIDDRILWTDSIETAFWYMIKYIPHCGKNGIIFNPEKFHFAKEEVEFAGFWITKDCKTYEKNERSHLAVPNIDEHH